jgi:hypothetical protein
VSTRYATNFRDGTLGPAQADLFPATVLDSDFPYLSLRVCPDHSIIAGMLLDSKLMYSIWKLEKKGFWRNAGRLAAFPALCRIPEIFKGQS